MYSVEASTPDGRRVTNYETAEDAMTAVNKLSVRHARDIVIRDETGSPITEHRLAMIVMEARWKAGMDGDPEP